MSSTRSVEKEGISFIIHRDYPNPTNGANVGNCSKNERSMRDDILRQEVPPTEHYN